MYISRFAEATAYTSAGGYYRCMHRASIHAACLCLAMAVATCCTNASARAGHAMQRVTFCMLTARRPGGASYLQRVAAAYARQNVHRMDGVGLLIVDTDGGAAASSSSTLTTARLPNRTLAVCGDAPDIEGLPSCAVRQRTLDVVGALAVCAARTTGWVVLVEDDCEPCPGGLEATLAALDGLSPARTAMAKFSLHMRATAFHAATRVHDYMRATLERLHTHPHDIVYADAWAPQPGARVHHHPQNLFHHIGGVSTEPHKNDPEWQRRYERLREDACFDPLR